MTFPKHMYHCANQVLQHANIVSEDFIYRNLTAACTSYIYLRYEYLWSMENFKSNETNSISLQNARPAEESTFKTIKLPFILITSLFFLWGLAHNLNPILIPHLKKACQLTDLQSALIDSAFFIGYFTMALPAGFIMRRYGYKTGIVFGLLLFSIGAFLYFGQRRFPYNDCYE